MNASRRLYLRATLKTLMLFAVAGFVVVLLDYGTDGPGPELAAAGTRTVELGGLAPGDTRRVDWHGRPILVLRRTPAMVAALRSGSPTALADPASDDSVQPDAATNPLRSLRPGVFVVELRGDLGCPVEYVPPTADGPWEPWQGGFREVCSNTWFDGAGRVVAGGRSWRNLPVPPHRHIDDQRLVLGGTG